MSLLDPRVWLALAFAFATSFGAGYYKGGASRQADWDVANAEQTALALVASEATRLKEKELTASLEKVRKSYATEKYRNAVTASANASRLRDYEAASASASSPDAGGPSGVAGPFAAIAGECGRALVEMDGHAQDLAATARALQEFAAIMRVK